MYSKSVIATFFLFLHIFYLKNKFSKFTIDLIKMATNYFTMARFRINDIKWLRQFIHNFTNAFSVCHSLFLSISPLSLIISSKKFKNDGNQKNTFAIYPNFSFDFGLVLTILRRFKPLCVVFGLLSTATCCQVADFFPAMIYIYICYIFFIR